MRGQHKTLTPVHYKTRARQMPLPPPPALRSAITRFNGEDDAAYERRLEQIEGYIQEQQQREQQQQEGRPVSSPQLSPAGPPHMVGFHISSVSTSSAVRACLPVAVATQPTFPPNRSTNDGNGDPTFPPD